MTVPFSPIFSDFEEFYAFSSISVSMVTDVIFGISEDGKHNYTWQRTYWSNFMKFVSLSFFSNVSLEMAAILKISNLGAQQHLELNIMLHLFQNLSIQFRELSWTKKVYNTNKKRIVK